MKTMAGCSIFNLKINLSGNVCNFVEISIHREIRP